MSADVAVLYQVYAGDSWREQYKLHFASAEHEQNAYYFYALDDNGGPSMRVCRSLESQSPAAILHLGQESIELEARVNSVWVKSYRWISRSQDTSFVHLPPSSSTKQILQRLTPEEPFKVGDYMYVLKPGQISPNQDIQVMSSRPSDANDVESHERNVQELRPGLDNRPSTPTPGSGAAAVMETPFTNRFQSPSELGKSLAISMVDDAMKDKEDSQEWGPDALKQDVMTTLRDYTGAGDNSESFESPAVPKSSTVHRLDLNPSAEVPSLETTRDPAMTNNDTNVNERQNGNYSGTIIDLVDNASSQTTEASSDGEPHSKPTISTDQRGEAKKSLPAPRNSNKRAASAAFKNNDLEDGDLSVPPLSAGPGADSGSLQSAPRKRQKGLASTTEESQNSVRSTIHVEVPHKIHSPAPTEHSRTGSVQDEDIEHSQIQTRSNISTPRNHVNSIEPPSSNVSSRSTRQGHRGQDASQDHVTRVLYASSTHVGQASAYSRFLRQHNIRQVKSIKDCDILCTGKDELKRTSKLMLAILMGKEVVTDEWVIQGTKTNKVLDTSDFVPEDTAREREWGTSLSDAIDRGRHGLKPLQGWTINFTPSAKKELGKSWSELKEICSVAGATAVLAMIPRKSPADSEKTILIAASNEADRETLEERGWKIFTKDIITFSVLRGKVDLLSDEFLMAKTAKGGARKSKKAR
ncbi:MAG: hypothetical protein Q9186_006783 [Xanthomendoza sp. 1 TL-2023]